MIMAEILFKIATNLREFVDFPACLPTTARPKNQIYDTKIQAIANPNFSIPLYDKELVPITPIVSIMA
jgi:hypothetical protein